MGTGEGMWCSGPLLPLSTFEHAQALGAASGHLSLLRKHHAIVSEAVIGLKEGRIKSGVTHLEAEVWCFLAALTVKAKSRQERVEGASALARLADHFADAVLISHTVALLAILGLTLLSNQSDQDINEALLGVGPALSPLQGVEDGSIALHGEGSAQVLGHLQLLAELSVSLQLLAVGVLASEHTFVVSA